MPVTIKVAYTFSTKHGYRARAYATDGRISHSLTIGLGDTREEAEGDAIRYVQDLHTRDGLPAPQAIERVGKINGTLLDAYKF